MTPLVLWCNCFTDMEDSATLGSDTSAVSGLREAVHVYCLFLLLPLESMQCLLETKAINPPWRGGLYAIATTTGSPRSGALPRKPGGEGRRRLSRVQSLENYHTYPAATSMRSGRIHSFGISGLLISGTSHGSGYFPVVRYS